MCLANTLWCIYRPTDIENELRTCIFYAVVNNKIQGDVPNFSLGTSPSNVFNPMNGTRDTLILYNQINLYKRTVRVVHI